MRVARSAGSHTASSATAVKDGRHRDEHAVSAFVLSRLIESLLFDVTARDPTADGHPRHRQAHALFEDHVTDLSQLRAERHVSM